MDCLELMEAQDKKFLADMTDQMKSINQLTEQLKDLTAIAAEYTV